MLTISCSWLCIHSLQSAPRVQTRGGQISETKSKPDQKSRQVSGNYQPVGEGGFIQVYKSFYLNAYAVFFLKFDFIILKFTN